LADGTPERLGRYRLIRPISTGGMARVYEARRESLAGVSPRVAIKVILPGFAMDEGFRSLFVNEAQIGSMLQHQNLVQIQDFDCEDGNYYLVMEYVEGITLRRVISMVRRHGIGVPLTVIAEIGRQMCDGLHYAHMARSEHGEPMHLVHRDIKPSNLMINPQGVVKLLDFGISKALMTKERKGAVRGTWGYMAPEQAVGHEVGPAADIFGLAAVLYELVALQPLFPEKESDEIKALLTKDEAARRATQISGPMGPMAGVLVRALQRDPAARFNSASAMGKALASLVVDPVSAREQVIHLQTVVGQLSRPGGPPVARTRTASTLSKGSQATGSQPSQHGSVADSGSARRSQSAASYVGLPVAVGDHRRPVRPSLGPQSHPSSVPSSQSGAPPLAWWQAAGMGGFMVVAILVVIFTGWRLLQEADAPPQVPAPSAFEALAPEGEAQEAEAAAAPKEAPVEPLIQVKPVMATPAPKPKPQAKPKAAAKPSPALTLAASTPEVDAAVDEPEAGAPEVGASGFLTVSATPRARALVDGEFVRYTPLFRHSLPAGSHTVTLISDDGQQATFKVEVPADGNIRRVWDFNLGQFKE
jgi:serine/threonine protein kinase